MCSKVQFVVFAALAASAFGATTPVYNVSSGPEDYTLLAGRHLQHELDIGDLQIATVKARHADRMESITNHQQLVQEDIQKIDNKLVQEQALNLPRKHCIQKFKPRLTTSIDAKKNFTQCISDAEVSSRRLTTSAENSLENARRIREKEVPAIFTFCNSTYYLDVDKENCVQTRVDQQVSKFNLYMYQFEGYLQQSLQTSSVIAAEANQCSFIVEKKMLLAFGAVSDLADICVKQMERSVTSVREKENDNDAVVKFIQKVISTNRIN